MARAHDDVNKTFEARDGKKSIKPGIDFSQMLSGIIARVEFDFSGQEIYEGNQKFEEKKIPKLVGLTKRRGKAATHKKAVQIQSDGFFCASLPSPASETDMNTCFEFFSLVGRRLWADATTNAITLALV